MITSEVLETVFINNRSKVMQWCKNTCKKKKKSLKQQMKFQVNRTKPACAHIFYMMNRL